MELSIITQVYKEPKQLDKFLFKMSGQTSRNYELILIVNTNNEEILDVVEKYRKTIKGKLKLVFNSKRIHRPIAIEQAAKEALGIYSFILSARNEFSETLVQELIAAINEKKADVIEFNSTISSPFKFEGKIRKEFNERVEIKENGTIEAYIYPFDFNKLFKTKVLVGAINTSMMVGFNSKYAVDISYIALTVAKTYATVSKTVVTLSGDKTKEFSPVQLIRQFESLITWIDQTNSHISIDRYLYAQYFLEVIFIAPLVKASKNKASIKKFNDKFKKQKEGVFANILDANHYSIIADTKERKALLEHTTLSSLAKAHKELG